MPSRHGPSTSAAPFVLALMLTATMGGCLDLGEPRDGATEGDATTGAGDDDGTAGSAGTETGTATDAQTDGDGAGEAGETNDTSPSDERPPEDREPAPAEEAEAPTEDDLDRPGEYAMRPSREDRRTDVVAAAPAWTDGDTWSYELDHLGWDYACTLGDPPQPATQHPVQQHTVSSSTTVRGLDAYRTTLSYTDCAGRTSDPFTVNRTHSDLEPIGDDGYVGHNLKFPLEDGKRWAYLDRFSKKVGVEITYVDAYEWDDKTTPAWHVVSTTEDGQTSWTHRWFVESVENLVLLEVHVNESDATSCIDRVDGNCVAYREKLIAHDLV